MPAHIDTAPSVPFDLAFVGGHRPTSDDSAPAALTVREFLTEPALMPGRAASIVTDLFDGLVRGRP